MLKRSRNRTRERKCTCSKHCVEKLETGLGRERAAWAAHTWQHDWPFPRLTRPPSFAHIFSSAKVFSASCVATRSPPSSREILEKSTGEVPRACSTRIVANICYFLLFVSNKSDADTRARLRTCVLTPLSPHLRRQEQRLSTVQRERSQLLSRRK